MKNPAIVITAFNRPRSLKRVLTSISNSEYPNSGVDLVISIDFSKECVKNREVISIANAFNWEFGDKKVFVQDNNLGLRDHILKCGDLLLDTFDSIILFEDDIFASPYFYEYVLESLKLFHDDDNVCGISLYSPKVHEYTGLEFVPLDDGSDNYFVQSASSWGQVWSRRQWSLFKEWYNQKSGCGVTLEDRVPAAVAGWPESSWKKYFIKYQVETNRFFAFPRISLSSNFGDTGTHFTVDSDVNQTPLLAKSKLWNLSSLSQSMAKYDCFYEIQNLSMDTFFHKDLEFDLYGIKRLINVSSEYLVSAKKCRYPIKQYSLKLKPSVLNVIYGIAGSELSYGKTIDFEDQNRYSIFRGYEHLSIRFLCRLLIYKSKGYAKRIFSRSGAN